MRLRSAALLSIAAFAVVATAPAARADDDVKEQCAAQSEQAQKLRLDGALLAARPIFSACSRAECPAIVRQDCAQWLGDDIRDTPSVVLSARDARGADLVDVRVTLDGAELTRALDGKVVEIDPGVHRFRFTARGYEAYDEQVVIKVGEKMREVSVAMAEPAVAPPPPPEAPPPTHAKPVAAYLLGGLAVVAMGGALAFDLTATSDAHTMRATCAPTCSASDVDWIRTRYDLALGALGVGVVSLGVAAYLFARPSAPASTAGSAPLFVGLAPGPRGVEGAVGARF
jgi:hypothetical protein